MDSANGAPVRRSTLKSMPKAILSVAGAAGAALRDVLAVLVYRFLIHVAADPYPAGELYDPSEEYELAREVLAMETLITGGLGSVIGAARVMRLLGSVEPLPGLAHCTAAVRTTLRGDDVYLSFDDVATLHPYTLRCSSSCGHRATDRPDAATQSSARVPCALLSTLTLCAYY